MGLPAEPWSDRVWFFNPFGWQLVFFTGFALMAGLAWHHPSARDSTFRAFFPLIERGAFDERNFVKKGVNWALRQIGKRNRRLNTLAIRTGRQIQALDSRAARWIADRRDVVLICHHSPDGDAPWDANHYLGPPDYRALLIRASATLSSASPSWIS